MGEGRRARSPSSVLPRTTRRCRAQGGVRAVALRLSCRAPPERPGERTLAVIAVHGVTRTFTLGRQRLVALAGVELTVADRTVVAVVGPNGSGKSTLLRLVAGLLAPDVGSIAIDGVPVTGPDPRVGLVFQEPRLLPWRTARDNVALPLQLAGWARERRQERASELLTLVGLDRFGDALPHQLSGGMRQRAAIARALALEPTVLLLDEPFSALDALTRERLNGELQELWARTGTTILLVTHDIGEAVFLADRVLVLSPRPGRVIVDVAIDSARPRRVSDMHAAAFSRAAAIVREALDPAPADEPEAPAA